MNFNKNNSGDNTFVTVEEIISIDVLKCDAFKIHCGGVTVRPPYLMIESFIELPDFLELVTTEIPESEGNYEDIFTIIGNETGVGILTVGYKNIQDGQPTHIRNVLVNCTER